jgi:hypothetical protein
VIALGHRQTDSFAMRHVLALVVFAACAMVVAGCSGRDAQEAQQLLAQSDAAFADVRSATFTLRISASHGSQEFSMTMAGGGYAKGKHAGDSYGLVTAENAGFGEIVFVSRDGRLTFSVDGQRLPSMAAPNTDASAIDALDIGRYVKAVRVEHGKLIEGEPMTKLSGMIDTASLVEESLSAFGELSSLTDGALDFSDALGDTHVVLYISDVTHLPMRGLVDIPIEAAGEKLEVHMDFAYTSINEPVVFPGLH